MFRWCVVFDYFDALVSFIVKCHWCNLLVLFHPSIFERSNLPFFLVKAMATTCRKKPTFVLAYAIELPADVDETHIVTPESDIFRRRARSRRIVPQTESIARVRLYTSGTQTKI